MVGRMNAATNAAETIHMSGWISPGLAVEDLDEDVADEAETDAVADVVGQRNADDRQERRERLLEVGPRDLTHGAHHEEADDDQRAGGDRVHVVRRPQAP